MHRIVRDNLGNYILGVQEGNDHANLIRLKDPLLMRYEGPDRKAAFAPFDSVINPREIRIKAYCMYEPKEPQVEAYERKRDEIWRNKDGLL